MQQDSNAGILHATGLVREKVDQSMSCSDRDRTMVRRAGGHRVDFAEHELIPEFGVAVEFQIFFRSSLGSGCVAITISIAIRLGERSSTNELVITNPFC
jgi:hypothetical protein